MIRLIYLRPGVHLIARSLRPLSTTTPCLKKTHKPPSPSPTTTTSTATTTSDDTFDPTTHFTTLQSTCAQAITRLKSDLAKLRTGQNEPSTLEPLTVTINKSAGKFAQLKDVAHVVTKGRGLAVTVYELANVKSVISAIQRANLNVQPIADAGNPQLINVPLPPPTKEARVKLAESAVKIGERTLNALRMARQESHKVIKGSKKTRPDDIRKADKQLEKVMQKANAEAKKVIDDAKKGIMEN